MVLTFVSKSLLSDTQLRVWNDVKKAREDKTIPGTRQPYERL